MAHVVSAAFAIWGFANRIELLLHGSEFELNSFEIQPEGAVYTGHFPYMYDAVYQAVVDTYLSQVGGFFFSSLLYPLTQFQTQALLVGRYPQLLSLQRSCLTERDRWCSGCLKCFRIAAILLAHNVDPRTLGIDLDRLVGVVRKVVRKDMADPFSPKSRYGSANVCKALQLVKQGSGLGFVRASSLNGVRDRLWNAYCWRGVLASVREDVDCDEVAEYDPSMMRFIRHEVARPLDSIYAATWKRGNRHEPAAAKVQAVVDEVANTRRGA
jgi:hypothetical protein